MGEPLAREHATFAGRVLVAVAILAVAAFLFWTFEVVGRGVLVVLAGVVMAVALDGLIRLLPLPRIASLIVLLVLAVGTAAGLSWWTGSNLVEELRGVQIRAAEAWPRVQAWLEARGWGRRLVEEVEALQWAEQAGGQVSALVVAAVGGVATLLLVPVFAVFFAISPKLYVDALAYLFPPRRRDRVKEVLAKTAHALRSWLLGRLVSMAVVGIGTALGLWVAGVPMAAGLGLIAGVLSFIPNVGPVIAAIPGLLVGLSQSPSTAFWALVVYLGVQAVDNYVVTPVVSQRAVDLPAGAQLAAQLLVGLVAGGIGLFMAIPLLIIIVVMVQAFYLQDLFHDSVRLLGQPREKRKAGWFRRRRRRKDAASAPGDRSEALSAEGGVGRDAMPTT